MVEMRLRGVLVLIDADANTHHRMREDTDINESGEPIF